MIFFLFVILITLYSYLKNKKKFDLETKEKNRFLEDEYLINEETGAKMTLEQAEEGWAFVDKPENFEGNSTVKINTLKHSESLKYTYNSIPIKLKEKITIEFISFLEAMIEEVVYNPNGNDKELTDELLEDVQELINISETRLTNDEIRIIWNIGAEEKNT